MTLIETIKDAIGLGPKGPVYSLDYLEHNWKEYDRHVRCAYDLMTKTLLYKRLGLMLRKWEGDGYVGDLLSDIQWKHLPNVASWVEREFIPKIRDFRIPGKICIPSSELHKQKYEARDGETPFRTGVRHADYSKLHAKEIVDALHFFLCDTRSTLDKTASLYGGKCTPQQVCWWYVDGKHIVERNMKCIEENFEKFERFAIRNGAR